MGERNFVAPLTRAQQKGIAIVPKLGSVLSFAGSILILWRVRKNKLRQGRVYHRILAVMSVTDLIFSLWTFCSTWVIPKGTFGVYGAVGTTQTCSAAGFVGQGAGLTTILYNGSLASFFLLSVRWGWSEARIRKYEVWLHAVPLVLGWGTAIAGLPLKLYNSIGINCWIAEYPFGCEDSRRHDGQTTCLRGDNAWIYRWALYHAELWTVWGFCVFTMIALYRFIRHDEERVGRFRMIRRKWEQSKVFAGQAIFFTTVFCITWIWSLAQWVIQQRTGKVYVPILFLQGIFVPLQGFFDAAIYVRPRLLRVRRENPQFTITQAFRFGILNDKSVAPGAKQDGSSNIIAGRNEHGSPVAQEDEEHLQSPVDEVQNRDDTSGEVITDYLE